VRKRGIIFVGLGLAVLLIPGGLIRYTRDLPAVDDSDLVIPRVELRPENNAYLALEAASAALETTDDESERLAALLQGEAWDESFVRRHLGANAPALAHLDVAIARPALQHPEQQDLDPDGGLSPADEARFAVVSKLASLVRLRSLRALERGRRGDDAGAFDDALASLELARRVDEGDGAGLVESMVSVSMRDIALSAFERLVTAARLDRPTARALVTRLEAARAPRAALGDAVAREYEAMQRAQRQIARNPLSGLDSPAGALVPVSYLYHPNRTLLGFAEHYRELRRRALVPCNESVWPEKPSWSRLEAIKPNAIGRILLAVGRADYSKYYARWCVSDAHLSATEVIVALRAYQGARGTLPPSLDKLVPEYLSQVPADGFDGAPIRYSKERRLVYSIGTDGLDAGGVPGQTADDRRDDFSEPSFAIPF
jgi:hypothetical protein